MTADELLQAASAARQRAYAPYSGYAVGCAVLADDGRVFSGCNVENASYGLSICAERNAVAQAVAAGARRFLLVAVSTRDAGSPCGACRQVLREFDVTEVPMKVVIGAPGAKGRVVRLRDLLPDAFGPESLAPPA